MAGNILSSGYHAVSAACLTTELNALADGATSALGVEIDNSTNKYAYADFQVDLASLTISSTTATVEIYLVPTVDGTNYPDWGSATYANYNASYMVDVLPIKNVTAATARSSASRRVQIPPGKFKPALRNRTGAALAASGSTLAIRYHSDAYT